MNAAIAGNEGAGFSVRVALALVIVGVISFAAFLVLSAFASDLRSPEQGGTHVQSKSAIGFAGIMTLLQSEGRDVHVTRDPVERIGEVRGLVVFTPELGDAPPPIVFTLPRGPDRLLVLPKWRVERDTAKAGWVKRAGLAIPLAVRRSLGDLSASTSIGQQAGETDLVLTDAPNVEEPIGRIPAGRIKRLQTINDSGIESILVDQSGHTVLGRVNLAEDKQRFGPYLWILADPDLLNTQGVASSNTGEAGLRILHELAPDDAPITFDMTLHGVGRSRNLLKLMLVPPFLPAVLCLAFAAVLMGVHAAAGGGVKRRAGRELALGKSGLVENSALLISLAKRELGMGRRYAAVTRVVAAASAGVPAGLSEARQADMLEAVARASRTTDSFSVLTTETATATTPAAQLRAVQRLYHWRQELMRGRQRS
ncbi:MAG: hypothetical protein ABI740_08365 [Alphaproteobacteria bacterium]